MKRFCKVQVTLNRYKGVLCSSEQDAEYTFEVEWSGQCSPYNDGCYTLKTFHNGTQCDLEFNGWCFAGVNHGFYHYPGSYSSVGVEIECNDPNGASLKISNDTEGTSDFLQEGAALYMNKIMLVCLFKDKAEYESICKVFQNYSMCTRGKDYLKDFLIKMQQFNEVIKRNEKNTDIPPHFIANAKKEYKKIVSYLKENVKLDDIFEALYD